MREKGGMMLINLIKLTNCFKTQKQRKIDTDFRLNYLRKHNGGERREGEV